MYVKEYARDRSQDSRTRLVTVAIKYPLQKLF